MILQKKKNKNCDEIFFTFFPIKFIQRGNKFMLQPLQIKTKLQMIQFFKKSVAKIYGMRSENMQA